MNSVDFMFSQRQQKMLRALLVHPDRLYGSNELIAIGGPGYGGGKRILEQFERSGIVVKISRGNQRLYSANTRHPIYRELRSICFKTFGIADVIVNALEEFLDRISLAFIFGSTATGTERSDSDVDLMIVGNVDIFELGETIGRIEKALGRDLDLNLYGDEEWNNLQRDAVIKAILEKEKIVLIER